MRVAPRQEHCDGGLSGGLAQVPHAGARLLRWSVQSVACRTLLLTTALLALAVLLPTGGELAATAAPGVASGGTASASVTAALLASCHPQDPDDVGYSPNLADGTVSIVNLTSHTVTGIISGFRYPWNVNVSPDGSTLFVDDVPLTDPLADRIDVVDLCSHQIVERIPTHGMAFSSISLDGSQLYTADITGGAVQVVDTSTGSLTATFPTLPVPIATASGDDRTLWIATMPDFLYSIDMRTGKVVGSPILTGIAPAQIAVSPDGSTLAVADLGGDIELIDTQTHRVTSTIRLPSLSYPAFGAFTPDGSELWMGYYSGQVAVIDMHTDAVVKVGQTGGFAVGIAFTRRQRGVCVNHPRGLGHPRRRRRLCSAGAPRYLAARRSDPRLRYLDLLSRRHHRCRERAHGHDHCFRPLQLKAPMSGAIARTGRMVLVLNERRSASMSAIGYQLPAATSPIAS